MFKIRTSFWIIVTTIFCTFYISHHWTSSLPPGARKARETSAPHILLLVADDLGYNDVPWHNDQVIAPNLHSLAKTGVILGQHYSQPTCSPTRAALLTGRYPFHVGMNRGPIHTEEAYGLPTEFRTLADDLKQAGYSTQIVGKWHLGFCNEKYLPTNRGFDSHFGFWSDEEDYTTHRHGSFYDMHHNTEVAWEANGTYSPQLFGEKAVEIIKIHNQAKPLFLYLPFQSVHAPLQVPRHYRNMQTKEVNNVRRKFLGMITAMDDAIGNVTQALENANMLQNTIIIFLSDNGATPVYGGSNRPLRGHKFTVFEGGTRTVAFINAQGLAPRTENGMMHVVDWYPTIMRAANEESSKHGLDGLDLWKSLRTGKGRWKRNEIIYNIRRETPSSKNTKGPMPTQAAIRIGDWKFIETDGYGQANLLFNLAQDPEEKHNVANDYPIVVEDLRWRLGKAGRSMYNISQPAFKHASFTSGAWETGWC